jgi:hypothetical protein
MTEPGIKSLISISNFILFFPFLLIKKILAKPRHAISGIALPHRASPRPAPHLHASPQNLNPPINLFA